jgi:hypothetical protein
VCQEAGLTAKRVPSNGAWSQVVTSGQGIRSVVLPVILPILPVFSCFSICRFGEGFTSHCL